MRTPGTLFSAAALIATTALAVAACVDTTNEPITGQPGGAGGSAGTGDTGGSAGAGGSGNIPYVKIDTGKVDVLFVVDNSSSMADKQRLLGKSVPDFLKKLIDPPCVDASDPGNTVASSGGVCPAGYARQFIPATSMRVGFVTSSLGGHGSDYCDDTNDVSDPDDGARLIRRRLGGGTVPTYQDSGILVWDAQGSLSPPGEQDINNLFKNVSDIAEGADQKGCGFESSLEAWYRFLIDPNPPASVKVNPEAEAEGSLATPLVEGTDDLLLKQRADFLRPDSLLMVVMLSDEDDCSVIDGAMPPDVCETPILDGSGKPTGCNGPRVGWPVNYARGNFQNVTIADGRVAGTPFPVNQISAQNNVPTPPNTPVNSNCAPRLDGKALNKEFCLLSGTATCATDPESPDCKSCLLIDPNSPDYAVQGCRTLANDDPKGDPINLRCWDQKRRFGVDMLYPLQRYIDGIQSRQVYDRDGYLVPNPLYANGRQVGSVILTGIVGVPWQDIARDPNDMARGYRPTYPTASEPTSVDWSLIQGNPLGHLGSPRVDPLDPLMIVSNVSDDPAHPRLGEVHPITGETVSATAWNRINGREWVSAPSDLQFACIFDLAPDAQTGEFMNCGPSDSQSSNPQKRNPLCEDRVSATDTSGAGTYDDKKQYRAKAYPAPRLLEVLRGVGPLGVVNSICASNAADSSREDFAYRPAINNIVDTASVRLTP